MITKKLALVAAAGVLVAALGLVGCSSAPAPSQTSAATTSAAGANTTSNQSSVTTNAADTAPAPATLQSVIGDEAAKEAALTHAGVAAADCTSMKVELDMDDNLPHYDVDFKAGGMEYEYDIDPANGAVLSFASEVDD